MWERMMTKDLESFIKKLDFFEKSDHLQSKEICTINLV